MATAINCYDSQFMGRPGIIRGVTRSRAGCNLETRGRVNTALMEPFNSTRTGETMLPRWIGSALGDLLECKCLGVRSRGMERLMNTEINRGHYAAVLPRKPRPRGPLCRELINHRKHAFTCRKASTCLRQPQVATRWPADRGRNNRRLLLPSKAAQVTKRET